MGQCSQLESLESRTLLSGGGGVHKPAPPVDYAPHSKIEGKSLGEWGNEWWKWAFSFKTADNPLFDLTGAKAPAGDVGKVFFLAGLITLTPGPGGVFSATRNIDLPSGTPVFFPILNGEQDNVGVVPPLPVDQLQALVKANIDGVSELHASLDGTPIADLFSHREASPKAFSFNLPATDNLYQFFGADVSGKISPAVADGYWVMLKSLSPGDHTINFGGTNGTFQLDLTYHIHVLPRGIYERLNPDAKGKFGTKPIKDDDDDHKDLREFLGCN
ncbi:MAG: hypothetical protein JWN40_2886 [Phycisphaerales bacterium]|nr:hypothetical protein [Phycisphaerales bacterium]